jgi:hypothetical protein
MAWTPDSYDIWTMPDHTPQVDLNICTACGEWSDDVVVAAVGEAPSARETAPPAG